MLGQLGSWLTRCESWGSMPARDEGGGHLADRERAARAGVISLPGLVEWRGRSKTCN